MRVCNRALTSIFSGPCIFSCAAKAFLKGVGVLGVGIVTVLRNVGVRDLKWKRIQYVVHNLWQVTLRFSWNAAQYSFVKLFYPSFSFWCLGVVSLWSGVLLRHLWPQTGVEVSAGVSKLRCSVPDMLQIWGGTQTDNNRHMTNNNFIPSTLRGISFGKVDNELKKDFIYSWWGEWQWFCRCFLGWIWCIFQERGACPITERWHFPSFFPSPPPNRDLGGLWWADGRQRRDPTDEEWGAVLILAREGSVAADCVTRWTVDYALLLETGKAHRVLSRWCSTLRDIKTGHVAPRNRVLQSRTHLQ